MTPDYHALQERFGAELLRKRLLLQARHWAETVHQGRGIMWIERFLPIDRMLMAALRILRLDERGFRNFLDLEVSRNVLRIPRLPLRF